MKLYSINEIFYGVQGEGVRAGSANLFVRFAHCNRSCSREQNGFDCDTAAIERCRLTFSELVLTIRQQAGQCRNIVFTGGEPALQLDQELISLLKRLGYYLAIETNGTVALPDGLDWICLSPKDREGQLKIEVVNEVKYVLAAGRPLPSSAIRADYFLLSPAAAGHSIAPENVRWCMQLVLDNPKWRLSLQQQKLFPQDQPQFVESWSEEGLKTGWAA